MELSLRERLNSDDASWAAFKRGVIACEFEPEKLTPKPRKSTFTGAECVNVLRGDGDKVYVFDDQHPENGLVCFTREEWEICLADIKAGRIS